MAIKFGMLTGAITLLIYTLAYFIGIDLFLSQGIYWLTMAVFIGAMYVLAQKTTAQGHVDFRSIVRPLFICFLIANAMYYIYYYVMITYVDPSIYEQQVSRMADGLENLDIENRDTSFQPYAYILSYFQAAIGGFIMASAISYSKKESYL
jgi:hypothetical protein